MSEPIAVAEAQARLLALASPVAAETVPLVEAAGRWAAEPVAARRTQPFADLSAMDGYAIRFDELPGPWAVVVESSAGSPMPLALAPGEAARIFTGAPVPPGADTILVQEDATRDGDQLRLSGDGPDCKGKHIRPRGNDFNAGTALIAAGALLTPARIALAATGGHGALTVRRRVSIALISTGNELVLPGGPVAGHLLPSSNAPMLATLLAGPATKVDDLGIAPDTIDAIVAAIDRARDADIIITTGGASVGDHDLVKPAFEAAGALLDFWKVAMQPGKPLMAGTLGGTVVLGLPGNPVSAFVTASLFARPLIAALGGASDPSVPTRPAILTEPMRANGARMRFVRGAWSDGGVRPLDGQDSAALTDLAISNLLIVREPDAPAANAGDMVRIIEIA